MTPIKEFFLSNLSKMINRFLALDPESKTRLERLANKTITIQLLPFDITFQCHFSNEGVHLQTDDTELADATIRGTPLNLFSVMLSENRQRFFADDLTIEGDAEFANDVIQIFDALEIDWEEYLSRLIGDVPAHSANRLFDNFTNWFKQTKSSFEDNINEYIHEEKNWFPTREALQDYFQDIDALRMDVDRMQAKINHLHELKDKE